MSVTPVILDSAETSILATIYDELTTDPCLVALLDELGQTITRGSGYKCGQPIESDDDEPVFRFQQAIPSAFHNAVVRYGAFQWNATTVSRNEDMEELFFRAMVYTQRQVTIGSESSVGDVWAMRVYREVRRILGKKKTGVASDDFCLLQRAQAGGIPIIFDNDRSVWKVGGNFRWLIVSRGVNAPADTFCPC